ncbi:MIF4G like domain-containing protein [Ditylenchus destructor]|nr:MIF4G like domain-containing protein [Ditylenchus destructor]
MEDFTRRRRLEPDDEQDGGDCKRIRGVDGDDIGPKLINMISRVDENIEESLENTMEKLADKLEQNFDPYEGQIISILSECAMYLPEKLTMFTTVIGLLNTKSSEFGTNMISKLVDDLNSSLSKENYDIALRLITFISDLCNTCVIDTQSILNLLGSLVGLIADENRRSNYLAYATLHALPWIGQELHEKAPEELAELLSRIEDYISKRKTDHIKMLQVWSDSVQIPQEDYLNCLWNQILKLKKEDWVERHIVRVYAAFKEILNAPSVVRHNIPGIDIDMIKNGTNFPLPKIVFRLFDYTDIPDNVDQALPPDTSIERFLVEEDLNWIIDNNYLDWRICAKTLLNYHRRAVVPLNYHIIEVIFAQLFRLPRAPHLELFYGALLIELCRVKSDSLPQVLAQAAELLYQRADYMQPICLDRFVNWFSYHLSNFQYSWSWSDWADCLILDSLHPRRIFVREVIEKCLHFSYHKRLVEFLPPGFDTVIPPEPIICYEYEEEDHPLKHYARDFYESITTKRPPEELQRLLMTSPENEDEEPSFNPELVGVFTAVVLKIACRTFSHSFAALTKYHKIFRAIVETPESEKMQSIILRTLYNCWSNHKQMMTVLVDKMMKMKIIEPGIVRAWVFCDEMKREFKRSWVWDLLDMAIIRLELHLSNLKENEADLTQKINVLKNMTTKDEPMNGDEDRMEASGDEGTLQRPKIVAPEEVHGESMDVDGSVGSSATGKCKLEEMEQKLIDNTATLKTVESQLVEIISETCYQFTLILTEHLVNCREDGTDIETDFYNYVLGRFRHVFLAHANTMWKLADHLSQELFNNQKIEKRVQDVFDQFCALNNG